AEYKEAIRLNPDDVYQYASLRIALTDQGKIEEAIAGCREAVRRMPDNALAHNDLAWELVLFPVRPQRDYDEALVHARKAVDLGPKEVYIASTLALAEYRSGHWVESIAASERSMALRNGGDSYEWFFLAMAHWQKGEKAEARKWFDKAVAWTKEKDP